MVLTNEIKGRIVAKGLTQEEVAKMIGISTRSFNSKLNGKSTFNVDEMEILIKVLNINNPIEIFFANKLAQ